MPLIPQDIWAALKSLQNLLVHVRRMGDVFRPPMCPHIAENLHRPGIEPGPPAWQASILPLNHRCMYNTHLDTHFAHAVKLKGF